MNGPPAVKAWVGVPLLLAVVWSPGAARAVCTPSPLGRDAPTAMIPSGGGANGALDGAAALLDPQPLRELITASLDLERIRSSRIRLLVTATDLARREQRVFDNRTVTVDALMGAAAIPGAFPAVAVDGTLLVDGGLTARAPILEALETATVKRAVVVMGYAPDERGAPPTTIRRTLEEAFETALLYQIRRDVELARLKHPTVDVQLLTPSAALRLRPLEFDPDSVARVLEMGRADARACLQAWEG